MALPQVSSQAPAAAGARQYVTIPVGKLRTGTRIRAPIWEDVDDRDVLLLAAGTMLTPAVVQRLTERGVKQVRVHPADAARLTGAAPATAAHPARAAAVAETERLPGAHWGVSAASYVHRVARHGTRPYDAGNVAQYLGDFKQSVTTVDRLFSGISAGALAEAPELAAVSSDSLLKIAVDMDLFVALGLKPNTDSYPSQHSTQTAMLAMAIGTMLGLKRDELIELGTGCLIHDAGMLRLKIPVLETRRELTSLEFLEVTKHPAIIYDLLKPLRDVPTGARMVAYQMHERCNGTGYPRRRQGPQIHPLARIAMVSDVFVALSSPRPWRPSLTPYRAMEQIIRDTKKGLFDPQVVRGLLHAVSLFPIGSFVETNDGRVGRVVRSNRDAYTKPIVELWLPRQTHTPEVVDLTKQGALAITKTLDAPPPQPYVATAADHWE